jgi:hypothetical protein
MIRESGAIAEEAVEFSDNVQRRRGLEGGEGGNGGEHGAVKGAGIVEEGAYDLWELLNLGGGSRRGSVSRGELWGRGAVGGRCVNARGAGRGHALRAETG